MQPSPWRLSRLRPPGSTLPSRPRRSPLVSLQVNVLGGASGRQRLVALFPLQLYRLRCDRAAMLVQTTLVPDIRRALGGQQERSRARSS